MKLIVEKEDNKTVEGFCYIVVSLDAKPRPYPILKDHIAERYFEELKRRLEAGNPGEE